MARPRAIHSLQEAPTQGTRNWLVYGDSGAGKTVLAGTAPDMLFLTVEAAGTESARAFGSSAEQWHINSWADLQLAYNWLKKEGHRDFEWVCPDSLSEIEELAWQKILTEKNRKETPAIQDYPTVWNLVKKTVNAFNRLPINVLYTAQALRLDTEDEEGADSTLLLPLLGSLKRGDLAMKVCGMVTLVGYLDVRRGKKGDATRRLWTEKTPRMFAKDRHDTFGRYIDSPNVSEMAVAVVERAKPKSKKKKKEKA